MRSVGGAFTLDGRRYPIGTAIFRNAENPADLHARLAALAAAARRGGGADRQRVRGRRASSLGSNDVRAAEGAARAARLGHAHADPVGRVDPLHARAPLRPGGDGRPRVVARPAPIFHASTSSCCRRATYAGADQRGDARAAQGLDARAAARSSRWPRPRGGPRARTSGCSTRRSCSRTGTSIGPVTRRRPACRRVGSRRRRCQAERAGARREAVRLADEARRRRDRSGEACSSGRCRGVRLRQGHPARTRAPGRAARRHPAGHVDTEHWLSAGQDAETQVIIEGDRVFAPLRLNSGRNVGVYATKDRLIASGLIWPENQDSAGAEGLR